MYPDDTTKIYSNATARSNKLANIPTDNNEVVFFGLQYFIKDFLIDTWNKNFFQLPKDQVVKAYKRRMDTSLGPDAVDVAHIAALHDLGYLPLKIKAMAEGTPVNIKVPMLTITNTHPEFFWLTNYLESVLSAYLWHPVVSATTARWYRRTLEKYAEETGSPLPFVMFQGHDFSFRGMSGIESAAVSGAAHLTSFYGTDTIPAIDFLEQYYNADADKELIGCSVPATEHSVMCMGGKESEVETFRRLLKKFPSGILSVVSDTWDFWKVVTEYVTELKPEILARTGSPIANKLVIRPDSGRPEAIICGDPTAPEGSPARKGAVQCLWDVFGGTVNAKGFKELDSHIGIIYGDSITPQIATAILRKLKENGFASSNIVFGIGSYTYQYVTRDTYGSAVKATYGEVDGVGREIFKDPITDNGTKKSAKGLLMVQDGVLFDQVTPEQEETGDLKLVFLDGKLVVEHSLAEIRQRISDSLLNKQHSTKAA